MSVPITKRPPDARTIATYDYRDETGRYVATKRRYVPKFFDWCRKQKDGLPPLLGSGAAPLPLYRACEANQAEQKELLFVAEGEKDADRLHSVGLIAVSTPHGAMVGAGKIWARRWTRIPVQFRRVVILEDNDTAGREHADKVGVGLEGFVPDLRVLRFSDLPDGGDVSDWLDAGHDASELLALVEEAPQWSPPEWPEPIPIHDVRGLPEFPTACLPSWLGDLIQSIAAETLSSTAVTAMPPLAAVAASVARKVTVHVRENWYEPLNLYTVAVAPPSQLKTPIFKVAKAPLEAWERVRAAALQDEIKQAEQKHADLKERVEVTRKKMARAETETDRRELQERKDALAKELDKVVIPHAPQLIADDVTEESLGKLLGENQGRIAIMSDEGGVFKNMAGRYQKNGSPIFEAFKHGHNAGTIRVNRTGRDPVLVPLAAITCGLMTQPSIIRALKKTPEFRGEGLLARFLYAIAEPRERDWTQSVGIPAHIAEAYRNAMTDLLNLPPGSDERGGPAPHVMELTPEARALLVDFRNEIESRKHPGGDLEAIEDWAGKLAGAAVRLAGLIHLGVAAGKPEPWRRAVTADALTRGITIARDFLIPHALAAFSLIGSGPAVGLAEIVLGWIRQNALTSFKKRDLHRARGSHVGDVNEWDVPLALLETLGWVRAASKPVGRRGGRPSEAYIVNPAALGRPELATHGDAWEGPES